MAKRIAEHVVSRGVNCPLMHARYPKGDINSTAFCFFLVSIFKGFFFFSRSGDVVKIRTVFYTLNLRAPELMKVRPYTRQGPGTRLWIASDVRFMPFIGEKNHVMARHIEYSTHLSSVKCYRVEYQEWSTL